MPSRILVAYASRDGSTAEIAEVIAHVLRGTGAAVDVASVKEAGSLDGYDAVVLGSAVHAWRVLPEAVQFAERHRQALAGLPVAYFVGCDRMREDTPHHRDVSQAALDALRKIREPRSIGLFAGKRDLHNPHPLFRWLLARVGIIEGDWRNWPAIRAWAAALPQQLGLPGAVVAPAAG